MNRYSSEIIDSSIESIEKLMNLGNFVNKGKKLIFDIDDNYFKKYKNFITSLKLEITQDCNLRCKYCIFSNRYVKTRSISKGIMSFETAKKSIDYYVQHSANSDIFSIVFAGGEPLLNMPLIKKVIEYIKEKYFNRNITFQLTTNGTLLKGEYLEFLVKNNVSIAISIDGPKDLHDKNRIFINGQGSFDSIMKNLDKFQKLYPMHFLIRTSILITIEPPFDLEKRYEFFWKTSLLSSQKKRISLTRSVYYFYSGDELVNENDTEFQKIFQKRIKEIIISIQNKEEFFKLDSITRFGILIFKDFHNMLPSYARELAIPICLPGSDLFVDVNGKFHVCYMAYSNDSDSEIGDINKGIDLNKIQKILKQFINLRINILRCYECFYIHLCKLCPSHLLQNELEATKKYCEIIKKQFLEQLSMYLEIIEEKPEAFNIIFD